MEKCIPKREDWAWDQPGGGSDKIFQNATLQPRDWISLWLCLLFGTLHSCSTWCSPKSCVWPEENGHLGRQQTSLSSSLMLLKKILLPVLSTVFPRNLLAACRRVCMPLLVEGHRKSWRNPRERQGFWTLGRSVGKEVSDIPVLPLESLLSYFVEGALLMRE